MAPKFNSLVKNILAKGEKKAPKAKGKSVTIDAEVREDLKKEREEKQREPQTLTKAIMRTLNQNGEVERLAFESDPSLNKYHGVYKIKQRLLPDKLAKRIAIQDSLVASIVGARQNHLSGFGRPRPDRFSTGFALQAKQEALEKLERIDDEQEKQHEKSELQRRIAKVTKRLMTCGDVGLDISGNQDELTFPQYLAMSCRNALVVGRIATEVLKRPGISGEDEFAGIRVIDAGTIYRAQRQQDAAEQVRKNAMQMLRRLRDEDEGFKERFDLDSFEQDRYEWIQVIDERPIQAFTGEECLVHNFYPVPDVELDGYPVTPLDTVISAVTTHINITTHNKLYFQSGRAARGMLVIKSDDIDEEMIAMVRQQFNAQINSVTNAWRMPVFGVGTDDEISWQAIDTGGRDMEFQYLSDMNAREILSAFQISPEELPGWSYLSRGTNNQALSEGNQEYKMEAARDVGIRPLLAQFEDFLNQKILPLFDPWVAERAALKLVGLEAETAEKESQRLITDSQLHMTYDEVLEKVDKKPIGAKMGGEYPLNPAIQAIFDKFIPVGVQLEELFGQKGASQDPQWAYVRDPFWWQQQEKIQQLQQMQAQQQAAAQGQPPPGDGGGGGSGGAGGGGSGGPGAAPAGESAKPQQETSPGTEKQKTAQVQSASASPGELSAGIDQAQASLGKAEQLKVDPKLIRAQRQLLKDFMSAWEKDAAGAVERLAEAAERLTPRS